MELIQVGEKTYYIKNPTNIGIYKVNETDVYLIDSGNDKDAGRKILKIIEENNWQVKGIINTHSHADHIGGNNIIQNRLNIPIYSYGVEKSFIKEPILESSFLYGGYPLKDLKNKFLMAKESNVEDINNLKVDGLEYFNLKGHYFDMIGIKTDDDVYFLGDSLFSVDTINKYHLFFVYDVKEYLNTLEYLRNLKAKLFIPSHCNAKSDISYLIKINQESIEKIVNKIYELCNNVTFEEIQKNIFDTYNLTMNINQYVLIGSTIKSYLSYLYDLGKISYEFRDNILYFVKK